MNINKVCQNTAILAKSIYADLFTNFIFRNFNYFLEKGEFPCVLKHADIVPVHKRKEKKNSNANYGLLSIFPDLSEIYEKLIYQQLYNHFDNILSPKQCGFLKDDSA